MQDDFGSFIKKKRIEIGLTQKQLALKLYVSESTISKWEKNKARPDISMISELSNILHVSEHELLIASEDKEKRREKSDAKKWRVLSSTWDCFFIISYSVALLTCFIVNLAVDKTLSWFFIVFFSILLSASFTTIPKFITVKKLLYIPLINLLSFLALIFYLGFTSGGNWVLLVVLPVVVCFIMVFLPIYIKYYDFPKILKSHGGVICVLLDEILILLMLLFISLVLKGNWFYPFTFNLLLVAFTIPIFIAVICRYVKVNGLIKTSIITFSFIPYLIGIFLLIKDTIHLVSSEKIQQFVLPNFFDWTTSELISSNVIALILISVFVVSLVFLICGLVINKKRKNMP